MIRNTRPFGAVAIAAVAVAAALPAAVLAGPAAPQAVTITTQVVFDPNVAGTFTATGPICASGTVEYVTDKVTSGTAFNVNGWSRFICDDNSGSFVLHLHPQANARPKAGFALDGPWSVWGGGGTGSYASLRGYGWFGVVFDWETDPLEGQETFIGFVSR